MVYNYISLKHVLERLDRIKLPGQDYNIEEVKEWAYDGLNEIGVPETLVEQEVRLEVIDGVAALPSNFESFIELHYDSNTTASSRAQIKYYPMVELGHSEEFKDLSYKIFNGNIHTDFDEGYVLLHYYSFPVDEEGWPLIPDTPFFRKAIELYLRYKIGYRLYWAGKIVERQLNMLHSEWARAAGQAKVSQKQISKERVQRIYTRHFPAVQRKAIYRDV